MTARILADDAFEEKNCDKAMQQYEKILNLNPKDGHAKKQYDLCVAQQSPEPAPGFDDDGIEMIFVKGGMFTMGCTSEQGDDCDSGEKPSHQVTLNDFYIGKYEITQKQWQAVMGSNTSNFKGNNMPVEKVSWNDVQKFIRKLNAKTGKTTVCRRRRNGNMRRGVALKAVEPNTAAAIRLATWHGTAGIAVAPPIRWDKNCRTSWVFMT
jgi:hypothetical protein